MVSKGERRQKGQEEATILLTKVAPGSGLMAALSVLLGQSRQPKPVRPVLSLRLWW